MKVWGIVMIQTNKLHKTPRPNQDGKHTNVPFVAMPPRTVYENHKHTSALFVSIGAQIKEV